MIGIIIWLIIIVMLFNSCAKSFLYIIEQLNVFMDAVIEAQSNKEKRKELIKNTLLTVTVIVTFVIWFITDK